MRLLGFSDLHRDLDAARAIVARSQEVDLVLCAGDLATKRKGLDEVVDILRAIQTPTILVPGNGESASELRQACSGWSSTHVLHGEGVEVAGISVFGIGGAIPETPFGAWSFDLEESAAEEMLATMESADVLVTHSPPHGACDADGAGRKLGSLAVRDAVARTEPTLVVCGHVHQSWGCTSQIGPSRVMNLGPRGAAFTL